MTIKRLSRKQVIVSMKFNNTEIVMTKANIYVSNINRLLKEVKSNIFVDFIYSNNKGLIITTNKISTVSDLNIIKKYIENLNYSNIISSRLF